MAEQKILVPDIGEFTDVDVIEVHVKEGDSIDVEDALITLETEKAAMDVPSPHKGKVVSMSVKVGDKVSEGSPILTLDTAGAAEPPHAETEEPHKEAPGAGAAEPARAAEPSPSEPDEEAPTVRQPGLPPSPAREEAPAAEPAPPPAAPSASERATKLPPIDEKAFAKAHASPAVRKFARELGVNLGQVKGTGNKGRIVKEDVKAFVKSVLTGEAGMPAGLPRVPAVDFAKFGPVDSRPLSRIKKIAGPRLQASWMNLPHVTQHDEADITELEKARQRLKGQASEEGIKLTPLAFIMRACIRALQEFPQFNASLDEEHQALILKQYYHLGFAVDTPNGLVVPNIRDADRKDIYELARELGELSAKARDGKLTAQQMQGGSFTISSLGGIGGTAFTPIINAPEVAILGVSRSRMAPVYQDGEFVPRLMLPLSLSYDHRVIDGAEAVRFTTFLGETLADVNALLEAIP